LAAGCKWGSEAIAAHAHIFHITAWSLPAIGTILAIHQHAIDGDPVAGICFIGNQVTHPENSEFTHYNHAHVVQDPGNLLAYILVPLAFFLAVGTSFLLAGFIALVRIRQVQHDVFGVVSSHPYFYTTTALILDYSLL
jgi:frizzled protein 5/8